MAQRRSAAAAGGDSLSLHPDRPMTPLQHRCPCGAIDVHTHIVPAAFPRYLGSRVGARWPAMAEAQPCHRHVMLDGQVFRTVSHQAWDPAVRVADLQRLNLGHQVLSPMPELLSYWLDGADGATMCRYLNDQIGAMVAHAPQSFTGLGAVPLQDVDLAIRELDHAMHHIGLAGVEVGSNVDGVPIGDARFLPFFEAAQSMGAAVFVHALRPTGMDRLVGPPMLEHTLAYPTEIGLAAASMITGGTLARCPHLRIAFSHGAGTLGAMLPRLQHAWTVFPALQALLEHSPTELARTMFVDDLVYGGQAIRHLIDVFGASQVMLGSDYPFAIQDPDPLGRVQALALDPDVHGALTRGNALRWLDGAGA
jgi:aminocarboxymuconate-semialdehyde decarboxylase